jgi:hypothetical protein
MKKSLLIGLALCVSVVAGAQQRELPKKIFKAEPRSIISDKSNPDLNANAQNNDYLGGLYNPTRELSKVPIASSSNAYGIFTMDQNIISTDPALDMIVFGNRGGGALGIGTGNDLVYAYSTDLGATWTNFSITSSDPANWFRYPSTVFYNPEGNTDPANMYAIFSGPYVISSGWRGQYFGSVKFDGVTDKDITFEVNESNVYLNHMNGGLCVTPGGHVHVMSTRLNGNEANYTSVGYEVLNGVFNTETNKVDWELPRVVVNPELDDDNNLWATDMVYSPDGSIGYLVCTGLDPDPEYNPYSYNGTVEWPVVYKTTDHGVTWDKIEPFDFTQIEIFQEYLYPTRQDPTLLIPRFFNRWVSGPNANGYTVDMNGNLHISAPMMSTMSLEPDSTNYFYQEPTLMFDVFMNGDGTWDAVFIDTIRTEPVASVGSEIGWDQRIHMLRNTDGSKVFTVWADTDPKYLSGSETTNTQPDIFTWGMDVNTKNITPAKNVTALGDYWADNFWLHVGNIALEDEDESGVPEYLLPMTTSTCTGATISVDNPWTHYYVGGVNIMTKVKDIDIISNSSLSQNYPNPFKTKTEFELTLDKPATVGVEVYSIVGQKVVSIPAHEYTAGTHKITINAADLKPGVYVYSIIANGERASRKMTVK